SSGLKTLRFLAQRRTLKPNILAAILKLFDRATAPINAAQLIEFQRVYLLKRTRICEPRVRACPALLFDQKYLFSLYLGSLLLP
ncbi:MAG: hypothetical protein ACYTX0_47285, partial [Nostoc sp.]